MVTMPFARHSSRISLAGIPKMKLNTCTFASSSTRTWSSNRFGECGLYVGRGAPNTARWATNGARLLLNPFSSAVLAPSSSVDTHKFIANGLDVRARISEITSLIASGCKPCAPNDQSPQKYDTEAVSLCEYNHQSKT